MRDDLAGALDRFDEPRAQEILDRLLAVATVDTLLSDVVLPYLHELGDRWERGEASIAQEHFASSVLRGRLLGLARGWGLGFGPVAVLACLPGEQHDLGLIAFGLALRARGWRIVYLGSDTPIDTIEETSRQLDPSLIVLNAVTDESVRPSSRSCVRSPAATDSRSAALAPGTAPSRRTACSPSPATRSPQPPRSRRSSRAARLEDWCAALRAAVDHGVRGRGLYWAVELIGPLLPWTLGFAAGAMLYVVVDELIPEAEGHGNERLATLAAMMGFALLLALDNALA